MLPRVAIVHEWFTLIAGSEKVLEQICHLYPNADVYFIYADMEAVARTPYLQGRRVQTSFIQNLPRAAKSFRSYLSLMPLAVEQFDMSRYDLVISSNHAVAKGVLTGPGQLHISYVHSPIRYAWDLQHQYLRESGLAHGTKGWLAKWMLHKMRIWDTRTAAGVDGFVANSSFIARRIQKVYGRAAQVIYPPVDVGSFSACGSKETFYLTASRLVPYKRVDLIVEAFSATPDRRLVVIGDGPEREKVRSLAGKNIEIMGYQSEQVLKEMMQRARAFVFAAEEDFGIIPVEAQACGTPVIAFGRGGALETVVPISAPYPTGVFFKTQSVDALLAAVQEFEELTDMFTTGACRANAERFSIERFRSEFSNFVNAQIKIHNS